jgi:hypothetical protein
MVRCYGCGKMNKVKKEVARRRKKLGVPTLKQQIRSFEKINFVGKNKKFFDDIKKDNKALDKAIAQKINKKRNEQNWRRISDMTWDKPRKEAPSSTKKRKMETFRYKRKSS